MSNRNLVDACLSAIANFAEGDLSLGQLRQVAGQAIAGLELVSREKAEELSHLLRRLEVEETYEEEGCATAVRPLLERLSVLLREVPQSA